MQKYHSSLQPSGPWTFKTGNANPKQAMRQQNLHPTSESALCSPAVIPKAFNSSRLSDELMQDAQTVGKD